MKIRFNTRFIAGRDLYQTHFIGKITAKTGYPVTVHEALDPKFSGYSPYWLGDDPQPDSD